jgi:hypothetical protein
LTHPDHLRSNIESLQNSSIAGIIITAQPSPPPAASPPSRSRGVKGREEAVNRGIVNGNGPHGGLLNTSKNVAIWGLPGKLTAEELKASLKSFRFASSEDGRQEVMKLEKLVSWIIP